MATRNTCRLALNKSKLNPRSAYSNGKRGKFGYPVNNNLVQHLLLVAIQFTEAQPRRYIDISEAPDRVKEIDDIVLPHYQQLHAHRLSAA